MKTFDHELTNRELLKVVFTYGLFGAGFYSAFFLLMLLAGFAQVTELRFVNYIIMCIISFYSLKQATKLIERRPKFLMEMAIVFLTCSISFVLFAVFLFVFSVFNSFIVDMFTQLYPGSLSFGRFSAPVFIASEGIGLSSVVALGMTFFYRSYTEGKRNKQIIDAELV